MFADTNIPEKFKINEDKSISPKNDLNKVLGMLKYDQSEGLPSIEDIAVLLSQIHQLPTAWYNEWREKICQFFPVLREAPHGSPVWWNTRL